MPTQEERLAALEQKFVDMELERLYEKRKTAETTPAEQAYDIKQVNHRLTMLLGIASGQESDIRAIKSDVGSIKERLISLEERVRRGFTSSEQRFTSLEEKLERVLQILTAPPQTEE